MALGVPSIVIDNTAPDHAQHLTTDVNDAFNRLAAAASDADAALASGATALTATVAALTATVAALTAQVGLVFLSAATASGGAVIDITGIGSTYDEYLITGTDVHPTVDAADLWIQFSEDGGSSFKSGAADYRWASSALTDGAAQVLFGSIADSKIVVTNSNSNVAAEGIAFEARLFAPANTTASKHIVIDAQSINSTPSLVRFTGGGVYVGTTNAVNAVRVIFSGGNIASGTFRLYGVRKS